MIKTGSDFSGVGAFDQALIRLGIDYETVFACDMDKYARQTYCLNFGEPDYYPENVYDREIPKQSLDIYMTSPPCQSFSLAGKRKGEDSVNGVLFYNSHEFIEKNRPRYFIFENVKGLLSDDNGKTFQRWIDYLGGKTVNGNPVIFPHEKSVPYHVYYQVMNAKHYGVPQNRERIFIVGIRDDADNDFSFPKPFPLVKRLKDVLEKEVDEKYFLSDNLLTYFEKHKIAHKEKGNGFGFRPQEENDTHCNSITTKYGTRQSDTFLKIGAIRGRGDNNNETLEINENGTCNTLTSVQKDNVVVYDLTNDFGEESPREYTEFAPALRSSRSGLDTKQLSKQQLEKLENLEVDENIAGCITHEIGRAGSSDEYIASVKRNAMITQRIRKLTPKECFRLMDFNEDFKWEVSDSQAYKQAGNSIVVSCLVEIIRKLKME
jgi:DNA (cytosine-5)-methyltransferase 1